MPNILKDTGNDLVKIANESKERYANANPFPSIYFNDFFNPEFLDLVLDEFPDLEKVNSTRFDDKLQVKFQGKGEKFFGEETRKFMHFLNSEPFLEFLQILTGIEEPLVGDPYFGGGGQHEIKRGGLLKVHADFNKHEKLNTLDRRVNVLVYLNKNWKEEYGGHFELWDKKMKSCIEKIPPFFNTMAIFSTTDFSYHGHPDPLQCPEGMSRKSLALYYYSSGRPEHEIIQGQEEHTTIFKSRAGSKEDNSAFKDTKIKTLIKDLTPPIVFKALRKIRG